MDPIGSHRSDRRTFLRAALNALATLASSTVAARRPAWAGPAVDVVRFGYQRTLWGAPAMVAQDVDTFGKAGAKVQMRALSSGKEVRDALIAGSLDAGRSALRHSSWAQPRARWCPSP
jgi:ABC-type nitrate/sulfonate/bicarbonate transport system substrate-binding protein